MFLAYKNDCEINAKVVSEAFMDLRVKWVKGTPFVLINRNKKIRFKFLSFTCY